MRRINLFFIVTLIAVISGTAFQLKDIKIVYGTKMLKTEYSETITVSGEFENENRTQLKFSYPLFVKEVFVKENDYVSRGQALFSVDTDKMRSAAGGDITEEMINSISYEDLSSVNDYSAIMQYANVADVVYAPSDGVVTEMNIYDGALVMKNSNTITVSDSGDVLARFTMSQTDFGRVKVGDSVVINPIAFPEHYYTGKITDKSAVIKKQASVTGSKVMIDVYASIDNPDKRISEGLQITGKISDEDTEIKQMLGYDYLYQDENGEYVYVFSNGKAEKVYVKTGTETETAAEILTAFDENTVFLTGDIKDGDRVIVRGKADEPV